MSPSGEKVAPPEVWEKSWRHFKVLGSQSPDAFSLKLAQIPEKHLAALGTAEAVFIDVLRATTTLIAIAAAGCEGIYVDRKPKNRVFQFVPPMAGGHWMYGGEQYGRPIRGQAADGVPIDGSIDNSPLSVRLGMFAGRRLRFYSTNGAHALAVMRPAQFARVYAMSCANIAATASAILAQAPTRIWLTCGGFYGCGSLEDSVAGGLLIEQLMAQGFARREDLDDEAEGMLILARHYSDDAKGNSVERLVRTLESKQVARLIGEFGHSRDVRACITGEGLQAGVWQAMATIRLIASKPDVPYLCPLLT